MTIKWHTIKNLKEYKVLKYIKNILIEFFMLNIRVIIKKIYEISNLVF